MPDSVKEKVLARAAKREPFWNREIAIPVPVVAAAAAILIAAPIWGWTMLRNPLLLSGKVSGSAPHRQANAVMSQNDTLVALAGGTYYQSDLTEGWDNHR
ncbi:hypothetical protein [Paenibacillus protaetiae]|nr:hypothetical protein [Paenibacillus protaetiae]